MLNLDTSPALRSKAHTNLAVLDERHGRLAEARRHLGEALRLDPTTELARTLLAAHGWS